MKMFNSRELLREINISSNDTTTVTENTYDTTVLPVGNPVFIG